MPGAHRVKDASDAATDATPTRKGLTLRPEVWRELIPLIERALDGVEGGKGDEATEAGD